MEHAQLTNLLGALALALTDAQEAAAREAAGLGTSACAALAVLSFHPGSTIAAMAATLGLTHSVMVRLAESLAAEGLLDRAPGARDRRQVCLTLTEKGLARARAILAARERALEVAMTRVPLPLRGPLAEAVGTMLAALTAGRVEADHICRLCDESVCPGEICPVECAAVRAEAARR